MSISKLVYKYYTLYLNTIHVLAFRQRLTNVNKVRKCSAQNDITVRRII